MADPLYYSTYLMLPLNGADGSTSFTDYGFFHRPVILGFGAKLSTTQSKYGGSSAYFDGTGDFLSVGVYPANQLPGSLLDYTMEAWVWLEALSSSSSTILQVQTNQIYNPKVWINSSGNLCYTTSSATNITSSGSVSLATWHHVAAVRVGSVVTLYLDGVSVGTYTDTMGYTVPYYAFHIGTTLADRANDTASRFKGYMNDVRYTAAARYYGTFTPPTQIDSSGAPTVQALLAQAIPLVASAQPSLTLKKAGSATLLLDATHGGNGRITGTVKEAGSPDAPVKRRVRLHRKIDGILTREAWSATDGSYSFSGIAIQPYYVTAFDHTGNYNAVIKDSITPEAMP